MTLQPAAGARDLNPQQVEINHLLTKNLADIYRMWGYEEVSPPRVERLATLMAGGRIDSNEIVKLVADEPLGLRPEMTASIARAACTRFSQRPRPLRLWAEGTTFESRLSAEGSLCIEENLVSGVELFGIKDISAEMELLSLLLKALEVLKIESGKPKLLIGHTALMDMLLSPFKNQQKEHIRKALIHYNRLELEQLDIGKKEKEHLLDLQKLRGLPLNILNRLASTFEETDVLADLKRLFNTIEPLANQYNLNLQLDPTFQPHLELYTGIVFELVCQGQSAPIVIARGGRYDEIMRRFGANESSAAGVGFSFAIDQIRELQIQEEIRRSIPSSTLVAFGPKGNLEQALSRQREWHNKGECALLELECCSNREHANQIMKSKGCTNIDWINA